MPFRTTSKRLHVASNIGWRRTLLCIVQTSQITLGLATLKLFEIDEILGGLSLQFRRLNSSYTTTTCAIHETVDRPLQDARPDQNKGSGSDH
jgi:hypothetical protein